MVSKKDKIEILKQVFKYGYATDTHINIAMLLDRLGVPASEYNLWNKEEG